MNLFATATGGTFINYLFGGSLPIMGVFLTMTGLDLLTGYGKALKSHTWYPLSIFMACLRSLSPFQPSSVLLHWIK